MKNLIHPKNKERIVRENLREIENRQRIAYHKLKAPRPPELFFMPRGNAYFSVSRHEAYAVGGVHWAEHLFNSGVFQSS